MKKSLESKAQSVLLDLAFAVFVFVLLFAFLYSQWQSNIQVAASEASFDELLSRSSNAVDALVSSKGSPINWESLPNSDINSLGLVKKKRVVDERKLSRFLSLDYNTARDKLKLSSFDFSFRLYNDQGADFNFGVFSDSNAQRVSFRRILDYNGVESVVDFTAYSK